MPSKISKHKQELAALEKSDPEFFAFLQQNDQELLQPEASPDGEENDSDDDGDAGSSDDESGDEAAAGAGEGAAAEDDSDEEDDAVAAAEAAGKIVLTAELLKQIVEDGVAAGRVLEAGGRDKKFTSAAHRVQCKPVRAVVHVLRAAAHASSLGNDADETQVDGKLKYAVLSAALSTRALVVCLRVLPRLLRASLGKLPKAAAAAGDLTKAQHFRTQGPLIRATCTAAVAVLGTAQDHSMRLFLLRALRGIVPLCQPFPKLSRTLVKTLADRWADPGVGSADDDEDEAAAAAAHGERVVAFLRLRQCMTDLPAPTPDKVLKAMYARYLHAASNVSATSLPGIALMGNCVVDALGTDLQLAYRHAFVYIRQLAVLLRSAMTVKRDHAVQKVLCWPYLQALKLWAAAVRAHGTDPASPMRELAYPLVQVAIGAARLRPGPTFFPLTLHLAALVVEVQWATGLYVPVAPLLLDVLHHPCFRKKPSSKGTGRAPQLRLILRVSQKAVDSRVYQEAIASRCFDLVLDAIRAHFYSPSLPELGGPIALQLRSFAKRTHAAGWRSRARVIADAIRAQAGVVAAERAKLPGGPGWLLQQEAEAARAAGGVEAVGPGSSAFRSPFMAAERQRAMLARLEAMAESDRDAATAKPEPDAASGSDDEDDDENEEEGRSRGGKRRRKDGDGEEEEEKEEEGEEAGSGDLAWLMGGDGETEDAAGDFVKEVTMEDEESDDDEEGDDDDDDEEEEEEEEES